MPDANDFTTLSEPLAEDRVADPTHAIKVPSAAPADVITDGEFIHLMMTSDDAERAVLLRRMLLRQFAEVSGMVNTALALHSDRGAWHRFAKLLAACRDASMTVILANPPQEKSDGKA